MPLGLSSFTAMPTRIPRSLCSDGAMRRSACSMRAAAPHSKNLSPPSILGLYTVSSDPHEGHEPVAPARGDRIGARGRGFASRVLGRRRGSARGHYPTPCQELADGGSPRLVVHGQSAARRRMKRRTARRKAPARCPKGARMTNGLSAFPARRPPRLFRRGQLPKLGRNPRRERDGARLE
jgi:hypothetical protein